MNRKKIYTMACLAISGTLFSACSSSSGSSLNTTPTPAPAPTPSPSVTAALAGSSRVYLKNYYTPNNYTWTTIATDTGSGKTYALGKPNKSADANVYDITDTLASGAAPIVVDIDDNTECGTPISMGQLNNGSTATMFAASATNICTMQDDTLTSVLAISSGSYTNNLLGLANSQIAVSTSASTSSDDNIVFYTWSSTDSSLTSTTPATTIAKNSTLYAGVDGVFVYKDGAVKFVGANGTSVDLPLTGLTAFGVDSQGNGIAQKDATTFQIWKGTSACASASAASSCSTVHHTQAVAGTTRLLAGTAGTSAAVWTISVNAAISAINLPGPSAADAATADGGAIGSVSNISSAVYPSGATATEKPGDTVQAVTPAFTAGTFFLFMGDGSVNLVTLTASN